MLAAWRDSPTRLREDAATEADLVRAGYRDRLLTELAQNAADAAAKAAVPGRLVARLDGSTLRIANTGVPLDISGVHALTALRVSAKPGAGSSVGRFGVGFTAVLSAGDDIEFRSTAGSLRFSRSGTWAELRGNGIDIPGDDDFVPPVLRLAWPIAEDPAAGFDSEIVVRLRDDVDPEALLTGMRAEAADLLLELPALREIRIGDDELTSAVSELGDGVQELRITGPDRGEHVWWQFSAARARWLLPVRSGRPHPVDPDVLRAPTRSDEELSLPALVIADIAMQPDRRRLLPGARIAELATGYADFAAALPPRDRLVLVPSPGFARSETDAILREALIAELRTASWLPVVAAVSSGERTGAVSDEFAPASSGEIDAEASGNASPGPVGDAVRGSRGFTPAEPKGNDSWPAEPGEDTEGSSWTFAPGESSGSAVRDLGKSARRQPGTAASAPARTRERTAAPQRASVFTGITAELAELLADVVGPLAIPELSGRSAADVLAVLEVHRIGLARIAELSIGLERPLRWWYSLYDALEPFVVDPLAVEELGALAVPLADGRLVTGPRTVVLDDELAVPIPVRWARLVHPEAAHPLLGRLGARRITAGDLLDDPALRAELEHQPGDPDTVDAVLRLAAQLTTPADPALPSWLGLLELPDDTGESLPADELLLPGAPLAGVLVTDSPFGTVDSALVDRYGAAALRAVGVGWGFTVVAEDDPTGPDDQLDDAERWWESLPEDPPELTAVRDLDLVDDEAWPDALRLLMSEPATRHLLAERDGYTAWWLRRHARIDGTPLGLFRAPDDPVFADLLPAPTGFAPGELDALRAVLADPDTVTPELAAALLDGLADPARTPSPEAIAQAHRRLAAAADRLDLDELGLPERVRALSGAVIDPGDAMVLDRPWYALAVPPDRLVAGDIDTAGALATLLDLPLVSEAVVAEVLGTGTVTSWTDAPLGVAVRLQFGSPPPDGPLVLHDRLRVRLSGDYEATLEVPWWRDGTTTHIQLFPPPAQR
ncbi:sacsin N-terminal ATP-binding-like domain-containing protein [Nocardia sp. BMG51109]|uniref:sacsin N-terminal ATP-binding-like domain-containing protein n=1 Tax=Nocardia sp. BMG51109 TaxID=1056816 RepID=UPI000465DB26|nr:hypothetical protein [Nocardia sp. BMG51109]